MADVLVVNPHASRVTEERIAAVVRALGEVTVLTTERPGHATELVADASGRCDRIYVFAGDGGFNEALNGSGGRVPLGLVPGGGTSVLPRALGLPRDPVAAAARVARGRERRISVGRVGGRRFGFSAGLGLDAELVRRVDRLGRDVTGRRPGDPAFVREALRLVRERRGRFPLVLEVEGVGEAALAFVANCDPYTYAGPVGLRLVPAARFELGLDFAAPGAIGPASLARLLVRVAVGRGLPGARGVLHGHDLDRLVVRCRRPTALQADGEDLGDVTEVVFEAERDAVAVLV